MKRLLLALLFSTFLAACNRSPFPGFKSNSQNPADVSLRQFLDVSTLRGRYEVPAGDDGYLITLLEFEDGHLIRKGMGSFGSVKQTGSSMLEPEVMWGDAHGSPKIAFGAPGIASSGGDEFWKKLDGGRASISEDGSHQQYEGYVILAFAQSDLSIDGEKSSPVSTDFIGALRRQKYVGALVVKTFKTYEEAEKAATSQP
ncbi:MAG: hypothetical protein WCD79_07200 [Chthoniobacteraceae bacterium]